MAQKILLKDKFLYYNGKMAKEEMEERGWEFDPFNGLKILKGEMERFYESDTDIQKSEEKIYYWKTLVETLEEIVTNINWRHQTIGNMIRWRMFEAGSQTKLKEVNLNVIGNDTYCDKIDCQLKSSCDFYRTEINILLSGQFYLD